MLYAGKTEMAMEWQQEVGGLDVEAIWRGISVSMLAPLIQWGKKKSEEKRFW